MISEHYQNEADEAQQAEQNAAPEPVIQGDYLVDPDTGEVLGLVDKPKFEVNDQSSAEWVLEKMQAEDAEILALQARLKALTENLTTMLKSHQQKRAWLELRFGHELALYAKENLPKGKKTWTCPFGKVGFTATPVKLIVQDEQRALEWAKAYAPEAVKTTEKLLPSNLNSPLLIDMLYTSEPNLTGQFGEQFFMAFAIQPDGERISIKTGV